MGTAARNAAHPPRRYAGGAKFPSKSINSFSHGGRKTLPLFSSQKGHSTTASFSLDKLLADREKKELAGSSETPFRRRVRAGEKHEEEEEGRRDATGTSEREEHKSFFFGKRIRENEVSGKGRGGGGGERRKEGLSDKRHSFFSRTGEISRHTSHYEGRDKVMSVAADYKSSRLFIRNLPPFVSVAELKEKFSSLGGEITDVCLLVNHAGRSRQCAFMGFKTQAQAAAAKEYFNATFFYTRKISVDFALPRQTASTGNSSLSSSSSSSCLPSPCSSLSSSSSSSSSLSSSVTPEGYKETRAGTTAATTATREERAVRDKEILQDSRSSSNKNIQQQIGSRSHTCGKKGKSKTTSEEEEEEEKEKVIAANACVVEEEIVHARKAGVSRIRKRLLFDDFFSSSDEEKEKEEKEEGEELKAKKNEKTGMYQEEHAGNIDNVTSPQQLKKKRRKKRDADIVPEEGEDMAAAAVAAAATSHTCKTSSEEAREMKVGAAGKSTGKEREECGVGDVTMKNIEGGRSDSKKIAKSSNSKKEEESRNDNASQGDVDDMTWLRQASAVAVAEKKRSISEASHVNASKETEEKEEFVTGTEGPKKKKDDNKKTEEMTGEERRKKKKKEGEEKKQEEDKKKKEEEMEKEEEEKKKKEEEALASLGVHGRLLLRNFPYVTTREELEALCLQYGEVAETHVVYDEETRKSKGYAFVTFVFPEHAVNALAKLDGIIFQGRLLHAEAAKPDTQKEVKRQQREQQEEEEKRKKKKNDKSSHMSPNTSSYKRKKHEELLKQHVENEAYMEEKVWNLLYVSANAAVDAVAKEFNIHKEDILISDDEFGRKGRETTTTTAARIALAETHLLQATKEWIIKEGISSRALERRGKTLLSATTLPSSSSSSSGSLCDDKKGSGLTLCTERGEEEKEEGAQGVTRSRDTLIVKHLPTAHVVGAELLLLFEKIGKVERFLLSPSKTVAIVQYEKERDAATAFRRLAYRKYKNVPLFVEKAPVDIFVGENEERRQAQTEAAEEARAAHQADILLAAGRGGKDEENEKERRRSTWRGNKETRGTSEETYATTSLRREEVEGERKDREITSRSEKRGGQDKAGREREEDRVVDGVRVDQSIGKKNRDDMKKSVETASHDISGVRTLQSDAVSGGSTTSSATFSAGTERTEAGQKEEEEHIDDVIGGYSLFVKNVNFSTTETALREVFSPCAGLRKVKLMTKKKPIVTAKTSKEEEEDERSATEKYVTLSLGYAFIEFDSAANAAAACKRMQDIVVDGHTLKISISRSSATPRQQNRYFSVNSVAGSNKSLSHHRSGQGEDKQGQFKIGSTTATAVKSRKLLVRNLAFQATTTDLRGLFSAYGNVTRVCIPTQHEGRSRGFGFVDFSTRFEAAAALQALSGTHLYGRKLVLEVAAQDTEGGGAQH